MFSLSAQPWCDQTVVALHRLPPRAFFFTAASEEKALAGEFDRAMPMSGEWDFFYTEDTPLDEGRFLEHRDDLPWAKITVPRSWQMAGYGPMLYTDEDYPFPVNPPLVPANNPTGVYRRLFHAEPEGEEQLILRLEGVESCASVYVNGAFAGYTQGSRLPAEFDLTALCRPGENELILLVRQYSDGAYLEDQDMWWLGGVIRDVYLLRRPRGGLRDVKITADYDADTGMGTLRVVPEGAEATFRLLAADGGEALRGRCGEAYTLPVVPWNAEEPYLYTLALTWPGESTAMKVGFRRVEIQSGELRLNGRRLMLRGVNRHEFSPVNGRAVTEEETRRDLVQIKRAHCNAVRTAHYPNNPFFYALCDELGLYVIDECDLETHGFEIEGTPSRLADDPAWRQAYLDRAERTYHRDKNHACVILWSLGNESFRGDNLRAMYEYFHQVDGRPVHYEGDRSYAYSDVISYMYSPVGRLAERDAAGADKPVLLCEFAHAMGNGPGGLLEYRRIMEASRHIQGYFIWEWRGHGVLRQGQYLHGGDMDAPYHSGNFCMDGLLNSDGTPTPGLMGFRKMNAPVRLAWEGDAVTVASVLSFRTVRGAARAELRMERDVIARWDVALPAISPGEKVRVPLPKDLYQTPCNALYTLTVTVVEGEETLEEETFILRQYAPSPSASSGPAWKRRGDDLWIEAGEARYRVSLRDGRLYDYCVRGRTLLQKGPLLSFYRPAMDNDRRRRETWRDLHLHAMTPVIDSARIEGNTLVLSGALGANARLWSSPFTLRYTPLEEGHIRLEISGRFAGNFGEGREDALPRIGTDSVAPGEMNRCVFLAYGPGETYCDSMFQGRFGWHEVPVEQMAFPYECPQESGNRTGCRAAALMGREGGVVCLFSTPGDMAASFYHSRDIDRAAHPQELRPRDHITWRLDAREAGLGSGSCGPEPWDKYMVRPQPFCMRFLLAPAEDGNLMDVCRKGWDELC